MEIVLLWLLLALGVGALASSRGRSFFGYFLLSAVFSPLLGLIVVLVSANLVEQAKKEDAERYRRVERDVQQERDHERHLASIKALTAAPTAVAASVPPAVAAAVGIASVADEVTKLADLRDRGLLTDEEFLAQKARVLAGAG